MLPRLYDALALRAAASLTETEFALYAASGLLPRTIGIFRGLPLFDEESTVRFCREIVKREPREVPEDLSFVSQAVAAMTAGATAVSPPSLEIVTPSSGGEEFVPGEMNQIQAADYLGVSPAFLNHRTKAGEIKATKKYGATVYSRDALDAFAKTPAFTLRRRVGFSGGKPKTETAAQAAERKREETRKALQVATGDAVLSRKGAADFLGISEEELRIMERDKLGPAYSGLGYRVSDLQAFKEQHMTKPADAGPPMLTDAAAAHLGVSQTALSRWIREGRGPRYSTGQHGAHVFTKADLDAWAKANAKFHQSAKARSESARVSDVQLRALEKARAARARNRKSQQQRAAAPKPAKGKAGGGKKSTGAKVKATKSAAAAPKVSPYNRKMSGRGVANGARARA